MVGWDEVGVSKKRSFIKTKLIRQIGLKGVLELDILSNNSSGVAISNMMIGCLIIRHSCQTHSFQA